MMSIATAQTEGQAAGYGEHRDNCEAVAPARHWPGHFAEGEGDIEHDGEYHGSKRPQRLIGELTAERGTDRRVGELGRRNVCGDG